MGNARSDSGDKAAKRRGPWSLFASIRQWFKLLARVSLFSGDRGAWAAMAWSFDLTSRALELDPSNDAYAYFLSAIAYFNLNQLPEAEERALKAEEIDKEHDQSLLQFLVAQIYEAKHDSTAAAVHFRECRKLAQDSSNLKKELSEAQNPK
jgi:tetratricopeptide (TPR) repeat protein